MPDMTNDEKVRENRLRRAVTRRRATLIKIRRRDPRAFDYGKFVVMPYNGRGLGPMTIEEVEAWVER
jgi:hypothetical protein